MGELQRFEFRDVFQENTDGTLSIRRPINVNGVALGTDVSFGPGMAIGGIDFFKFKNHPIAAENSNGSLLIRGFFEE